MELAAFILGGFFSTLMLIVLIVGAILVLNLKSKNSHKSNAKEGI